MANELENNIFLVNAPAGSGKTTWIRKKVEGHLLQFPDDNILCITYTNRAAEELNKENEYYSYLVKTHIDKYLGKPNMTNLKPCIRESIVYGALSAYRLFYVGCSRARRNLEIIIRNEDVMAFKDRLSSKFVQCGFEILQE